MKRTDDEREVTTRTELRKLAHVTPPPSLVAKVMQEIEKPAPFHFWNWLSRPRRLELRFSPFSAALGAGALAVLLWAVSGSPMAERPLSASSAPRPVPTQTQDADVVLVRFVLHTQGAQQVSLAGDFNGWDPQATPLAPQGQGDVFAITLPLRKGGTYQYMFFVDGQWVADPTAELRPDGFGQQNSLLRL